MNFYGEYGEKNIVGPGTDGSAMYLAADFTLFSQSLILEYKKYEDFLMRSSIISYNNPPSCIREPSYTLQSRYVHQQDLSNEQGFGATYYGYLPYDIGLEMSFAQTSQIDDSDNSYTEFYTDIYREWNRFSQHVIFQYQDEQTNKKEQFTTLILNGYYLIDAVHNITWDLEYQIENNEFTDQTYNHYMAGFEGVIIPNLSAGFEVSMIEELDIGETEPEAEASPWAFVSCDIVEGHSIIAGYGKRAGGFTCSGGICRYEKPFEGFELSIVSSF
jgi:hypothetical protein